MVKPEILGKKTVFDESWIKIVEMHLSYSDKEVKFLHEEGQDIVVIIATDENNDVYFVKEWRPAWEEYVIQLPAGGAGRGKSEEELLAQARNELREEIGMDAKHIEKIYSFILSARMRSRFHLYLATDLFESKKDPDEFEFIEVIKIPQQEAFERFLSSKEETTASTLIGLQHLKDKS